MEFSRPEKCSGYPFPSPADLSNPGIEPRSPTLKADSLPAEPSRKPKNTGVASLSLLQQIFPTQESNEGLLYCRRILYQLSYQGNPFNIHFQYTALFIYISKQQLRVLGGSVGKESACNAGDLVSSLGQKNPLEKRMATHSSILAWRIPRKRNLALLSMRLQSRV